MKRQWTIVSGCEVLAKTEYISRCNNAAAYLHWSICKDHDIEITDKWYQHAPETVIHNKDNNIPIMWDMPVNTDRTITANRPDIIVKDSVNSTCKLFDMTVPSDRNIALKEIEKKSKYKDLELEIQRMWHMKTIYSNPCGCWCTWYSKEGDGRKHQESIRESHCDRDSKDLHAGICANPRKGA